MSRKYGLAFLAALSIVTFQNSSALGQSAQSDEIVDRVSAACAGGGDCVLAIQTAFQEIALLPPALRPALTARVAAIAAGADVSVEVPAGTPAAGRGPAGSAG